MIEGRRRNLQGRIRCFDCRPFKPRRTPRGYRRRPPKMKVCEGCGAEFAAKQVIDGKLRSLYRRRFCLTCSPFGSHNTSKRPPGIADPEELVEHRRRRRNAKTYRSLKKRRQRRKLELVRMRGGRCEDCAYDRLPAALEFHHRDPSTKEFGLGNFQGSWERLLAEAAKCDLLCANCHRLRHAGLDERPGDPVVEHRRARKLRAIAYMGGCCEGCGYTGPAALFEFHHRDPKTKDFGLSEHGIPRRWEKIVVELAKCVMLCANCHREVHAGVRELGVALLGLAETAEGYAA